MVLYHAFPSLVPGGFVGVDVFFVISGFLITQLMLREVERSGHINLAEFWARRIRRILPAAVFVLCATAVIAALLTSTDMRQLGRHIIAACLSYYNWRQAADAVNYLARQDSDNPLMHYWSLSVEEQFYLVWPLLIAGAAFCMSTPLIARYRKGAFVCLTGALLCASLVYSIDLTSAEPQLAYFSTLTRAWQLLVGAFIAITASMMLPKQRLVEGATLLAIGLLLASFILISGALPYPGVAAILPTAATAGLLYFGARSMTARALSVAPLRYVGRISYSWYLWHWPLLVLLGPALVRGRLDQQTTMLLAVGASFVLAVLTFHLIEQPARHSARLRGSRRATYLFGAALMAVGLAFGFGMKHLGSDSVHLGDGVWRSRRVLAEDFPVLYRDKCVLRYNELSSPACTYGAPGGTKTVVLFGDSHSANWFVPLEEAARMGGWRLIVRAKAACPAGNGVPVSADGRPYPKCEAWRQNTLSEIAALKPDLIILGRLSARSKPDELTAMRQLAAISPTIIMRDTPMLPESPADCLARALHPADCSWAVSPGAGYPLTAPSDLPPDVRIVDLIDRICPNGTCHAVTAGHVLMADKEHLSASFPAAALTGEFETILSHYGK